MLKVNKYMKTLTHYIANMVLAAAACAVLAAVGVVLHTPTPAAQAAAVATTVSNNGLVGYWSFNDRRLWQQLYWYIKRCNFTSMVYWQV
jgi:hypothetical protein